MVYEDLKIDRKMSCERLLMWALQAEWECCLACVTLLFCVVQVEGRAHEVWGDEEGLKEAHRKKGENQEKKREKKYASQIKGLQWNLRRMNTLKIHPFVLCREAVLSLLKAVLYGVYKTAVPLSLVRRLIFGVSFIGDFTVELSC